MSACGLLRDVTAYAGRRASGLAALTFSPMSPAIISALIAGLRGGLPARLTARHTEHPARGGEREGSAYRGMLMSVSRSGGSFISLVRDLPPPGQPYLTNAKHNVAGMRSSARPTLDDERLPHVRFHHT